MMMMLRQQRLRVILGYILFMSILAITFAFHHPTSTTTTTIPRRIIVEPTSTSKLLFLHSFLQPPAAAQQQQHGRRNFAFPLSTKSSTSLNMLESFMDPTSAMESIVATTTSAAATVLASSSFDTLASSSLFLSFADQGQNLAGIFFQASLIPYLLFLYFVSFRANRVPPLANFGFQFVLLFVLSTIPSGIISKSTYGVSLANCDWLHGSAEALLTIANIFIVLGFKEAISKASFSPPSVVTTGRNLGLAAFGVFALACVIGPSLLDAHTPFLFGWGNLPTDFVTASLPWVSHTDPINSLSIPTWMIHFSSVFEYIIAMKLIWDYSKTTQNPKYQGLTWGMLPLHASGICACTYHIFFNSMQYLVTLQAFFTLLGNITCALASFRLAKSNGWTLNEINPFPKSSIDPTGLIADGISSMPLLLPQQIAAATTTTSASSAITTTTSSPETNAALLLKVVGLTVATSYLVKYGELGIDVFFEPNPVLATTMVLGIPALTAWYYYNQQQQANEGSGDAGESNNNNNWFNLFNNNKEGSSSAISMDTIKQYGVAGTVAYVITEVLFWMVAFPVAAYALHESTGHWPDVVGNNADRAAVLAFIVAGANIARVMVPLRFGAALALAPWVDENILQRMSSGSSSTTTSSTPTTTTTTASSTAMKTASSSAANPSSSSKSNTVTTKSTMNPRSSKPVTTATAQVGTKKPVAAVKPAAAAPKYFIRNNDE